jgi:hypothetical protein
MPPRRALKRPIWKEANLEKAAGGDLISYMFDALKEAATREMDRLP